MATEEKGAGIVVSVKKSDADRFNRLIAETQGNAYDVMHRALLLHEQYVQKQGEAYVVSFHCQRSNEADPLIAAIVIDSKSPEDFSDLH